MKTHRNNVAQQCTKFGLFGLFVAALISGCGSGSGASVQEIATSSTPQVSSYSGPAPASEDAQNYMQSVWVNLESNARCGSCHKDSQSPRFVRDDDINLALEAAKSVADLSDPSQSILVSKVRGGHNCWVSNPDVCADVIREYITNWAGNGPATASKSIELTAPTLREPGASKNFPATSSEFQSTVYPLLTTYCSNCHSDTSTTPQQPYFA